MSKTTTAIDLSLAPTPPMGFNTWNLFQGAIDERLMLETAESMAALGMRELGYRYVNLDDAWMTSERTRSGRLAFDHAKFPRGIVGLADDLHQMGFKLGIYSDAGTHTCMGLPASYGHEREDAETFAEWGVDYLKYDWCHVPFDDFPGQSEREVAELLYTRIAEALSATGRPMVLSMCNWGGKRVPWEWGRGIAHLWRTTGDIEASYSGSAGRSVCEIFRHNVTLADYAGPGGWNDPDMLEVGNDGLSDEESRTHFSLWAIMAAPLVAGNDLRDMTRATREILTNPEVVALDQDPLGRQGRVVAHRGDTWVVAKPLAGNEVGVVCFNEGDEPAEAHTDASEVGLPGTGRSVWRDCWEQEDMATTSSVEVSLQPHAVAVLRARAVRV